MPTDFAPARSITVAADRLPKWVDSFTFRHGSLSLAIDSDILLLHARNGACAAVVNPWGDFRSSHLEPALQELRVPRQLGVLLVRRGAHAIGVHDGHTWLTHRCQRHHVQGRTKAGGWSQQRFARRRDNQAAQAYQKAADDCAEILLPAATTLDAVVLGGDRIGLSTVLDEHRLHPLAEMVRPGPILAVPEARFSVLEAALVRAYDVRIDLDAIATGEVDMTQ